MTLIFQIAVGILLGYLLIEHRHRLGKWTLSFLKAALAMLVLVLIGWGLSTAVSGSASVVSENWTTIIGKVVSFSTVILILVMFVFGGGGLTKLLKFAFPKLEFENFALILISMLNVAIVWLAEIALRKVTAFDGIYRSVEQWSWSNGYQDSGPAILSFGLCLWPWVIIAALRLARIEVPKIWVEEPEAEDVSEEA